MYNYIFRKKYNNDKYYISPFQTKMSDKKENIDFGVDYSMVLESLMEQYDHYCDDANLYDPSCIPPSCIPCIIPSSLDIYSNLEKLQLESKIQNSTSNSAIININLPLQFTSRYSNKPLENHAREINTSNFPNQTNYKIKKLGLLY